MSGNVSAQALFTAGLTREQFIQKYSELQKTEQSSDSSIFTDDFANSLGQIFDTLNTSGNDTLDADEITTLQGMGDDDNTTLSDADLKALYSKMGKDILNKYANQTSPEDMYRTGMAGGNNFSNTYIQDLNQQISVLRELICLRQLNSTNIQQTYQFQIDELVKKDTQLTTEQKIEYINLSDELSSLQKQADKNAVKMKALEEKIKNNENEIKLTEQELAKLDPNNEEDSSSYATWNQDLNRLLKTKEDLNYEYSNLANISKRLNKQIGTTKKSLDEKNDEINRQNPELKNRIMMYQNMIEQEKNSSKNEIEAYENQIIVLEKAQEYAIEQLKNNPPVEAPANNGSGVEGSHQNDNLMSFAELESMGLEYSSENGQLLAGTIRKHLKGFTGYCSRHVSNALAESGLGNERCGSAADMDTKLENNPNFKEIKVSSADDLKRLPAGCILVYERGAARYNAKHGHIEVTLGDGTAGSDGVTRNIRYTENMSVFVPVKKAA